MQNKKLEKQFFMHQMWLSKTPKKTTKETAKENESESKRSVPENFDEIIKDWKTQSEENGFKYKFWFNEDIDQLWLNYPEIKKKYKHFYENVLSEHIEKCDFARILVIAIYGGIYIDLDLAVTNFKEWLTTFEQNRIYLYMDPCNFKKSTMIEAFSSENTETLHNGTLVSLSSDQDVFEKQSKFWFGFLDMIVSTYSKYNFVLATTGPVALTRYVDSCTDIINNNNNNNNNKNKNEKNKNINENINEKNKITVECRKRQELLQYVHTTEGNGSGWCRSVGNAVRLLMWSFQYHYDVQILLSAFLIFLFFIFCFTVKKSVAFINSFNSQPLKPLQ